MEGTVDDSQEAAEAMVQLGSMGFYQQGDINEAETLMFKGKVTVKMCNDVWK